MAHRQNGFLRPRRLFGLYVLVELLVVVGLTYAIGFGWTVLLLLGTFAFGIALAGSQMTRQLSRLRSGLAAPEGVATDSLLIALGTVLTVVPGLVSSVVGLLLLAPPTRRSPGPQRLRSPRGVWPACRWSSRPCRVPAVPPAVTTSTARCWTSPTSRTR
jgi:UPF0716 family protein affecting phage T7 exclusion